MRIFCIFIVLNEEQYIGATLSSYLKRPEVVGTSIVEGAAELYTYRTADGLSLDNTMGEVTRTVDVTRRPGDHTTVIWQSLGLSPNKTDLWNRALTQLREDYDLNAQLQPEDWVLLCCGDEIYRDDQWELLMGVIKANPTAGAIYLTPYHFWKDFDHLTMGSQWDKSMPRAFRYCDKSVHFTEHNLAPVIENADGTTTRVSDYGILYPAIHAHHYGAVKPVELIQAKLAYYKRRDKDLNVKDTFTDYQEGQPTQWTHGGGYVVETRMDHPGEIRELMMNKEWCERWGIK